MPGEDDVEQLKVHLPFPLVAAWNVLLNTSVHCTRILLIVTGYWHLRSNGSGRKSTGIFGDVVERPCTTTLESWG